MSTTDLATSAHNNAARQSSPHQNNARAMLIAGLPVRERTVELAGISTTILEGGDGQPMLLLHGPGEYGPKWLRIIPDLVDQHRVIAPDLPGHGASAPIQEPVDPARVLAWMGELIELTCPTPPIIVGQILGGAIAARFAAANPDRLRSLVLCGSLGLMPFQPAPISAKR